MCYDIVKYLIKAGADVHAQDDYSIRWASHFDHFKIVKYLLGEAGVNREKLIEKHTK
jgi:ankyrin repeat protein